MVRVGQMQGAGVFPGARTGLPPVGLGMACPGLTALSRLLCCVSHQCGFQVIFEVHNRL